MQLLPYLQNEVLTQGMTWVLASAEPSSRPVATLKALRLSRPKSTCRYMTRQQGGQDTLDNFGDQV